MSQNEPPNASPPRIASSCPDEGSWRWIHTGDDAFAEIISAINTAQHTIDLEIYIFTNSDPGRLIRDALIQAAKRGVRVRVLLDCFGSIGLTDGFWTELKKIGGQVHWFNPLTLRHFNVRNHRKLVVADQSHAFVGGFNIGQEWVGDGIHQGWRDLGLIFTGGQLPVILSEAFEQMLQLANFQHRHPQPLRRRRGVLVKNSPLGMLLAAGPGRGPHPIRNSLLRDLRNATNVKIVASYFLPPGRILRALQRVARRGGSVQIILPARSDLSLFQSATRGLYGRLLRASVRLFEYQPQILHTKFVHIDQAVYVGSANLERRSLGVNYDFLIRLTHPKLVAEGHAVFAEHLRHSIAIDRRTWNKSRTPWERFKEWIASTFFARIDPYLARSRFREPH